MLPAVFTRGGVLRRVDLVLAVQNGVAGRVLKAALNRGRLVGLGACVVHIAAAAEHICEWRSLLLLLRRGQIHRRRVLVELIRMRFNDAASVVVTAVIVAALV